MEHRIVIDNLEKILPRYKITSTGIESISMPVINIPSAEIRIEELDAAIIDDEDVFPEGKEKTILHKKKERNAEVVKKKKRKVILDTGKLACEVCKFDFFEKYGELGYGYAECHHIVRVCNLNDGTKTRLQDLAIVCANCHRMIHRSRPRMLTLQELRDLFYSIKQYLRQN